MQQAFINIILKLKAFHPIQRINLDHIDLPSFIVAINKLEFIEN